MSQNDDLKSKQTKTDPVVFRFLDRQSDIEISSGYLPHWFQPGSATFITIRTADSLPKEVVERLQHEFEQWLEKNGLPLELALYQGLGEFVSKAAVGGELEDLAVEDNHRYTEDLAVGDNRRYTEMSDFPLAKQIEFKRLRDRAWHTALDECHGECLLKQPQLAAIVAEAILHHADKKYDIDSFIVMPNHVHAIVQFRPGSSLSVVSQSWMRYTARQIHFKVGGSGEFWQSEPFDHIIRSPEQFEYLQQYVAENPAKANLSDGEFLYWSRSKQ